ncbi:MAG: ankyrin repeat domain-containing protein [Bacteroidota bacterium]
MDDYLYILDLLRQGDLEALDALRKIEPSFPDGTDPYLNISWILHTISEGSIASIKWILRQGLDLNFRDASGETPLHTALELDAEDRYGVIELLIEAGADVNLKGGNDWTPAHHAAARNDVKALTLLVDHGADLSIKTSIDDYTTPLEEAKLLSKHVNCSDAIAYLESLEASDA